VLVPISNWAAFGGSKEIIIWLPIDMISETITILVSLRKQVIDDIYQIMGLSDIMRGASDPNETLGAQQLKSQYGSTRIRDKQSELVRLARDLVEIATEIITEKFDPVTMIEMSQTQLPTQQMQKKMIEQIQQQMQQAMQMMQSPPLQPGQPPQPGQPQPQQQMQQVMQQGQAAIKKVMEKPTIEQVLTLLKNQRMKNFVLDIETDSTIVPNEQAEKQQRTEFVGVLSQLLPQLSQMVMMDPNTAAFCGEILKFAVAPFRAGRTLDGAVDELVDQMKAKGGQPKGDSPAEAQNKTALQIETMKDQTAQQKLKAEGMLEVQKLKQQDDHKKLELQNQKDIEAMKLKASGDDVAERQQHLNQELMQGREEHQQEMIKTNAETDLLRQKADLAMQAHTMKQDDMRQRQAERQAAAQFKQTTQGFPP
jgi:hypothetical protein